MFEATLLSAIAFLLLAAASHGFRREAGATRPRDRAILRVVASVLLAIAFVRSGTALPGERYVRFLCAASIGGGCIVLPLSIASAILFSPLRWALVRVRRPGSA